MVLQILITQNRYFISLNIITEELEAHLSTESINIYWTCTVCQVIFLW